MADYYCALPIVSIFLDANPPTDLSFLRDIPDKAPQLLSYARKLRSLKLFKEAFVHVVGQWHLWGEDKREDFRRDVDTRLLCLVEIYHGRVREKVATVSQYLLGCSLGSVGYYPLTVDAITREIVREELQKWGHHFDEEREAEFYRHVYETSFTPNSEQTERYRVHRARPKRELAELAKDLQNEVTKNVHKRLDPLMENYLLLDRGGDGAGEGRFYYFLCTELADEDLPWDVDQLEW